MHTRSLTSSNGFTLLEVLVALVILGLTIAFLTETISDSLLRSGRVDAEDRAGALADATLARLGDDIPLRIGTTQGEAGGLFWRLLIISQPSDAAAVPLDIVELTIFTPAGRPIGQWQTLRVAGQATRQ